MHEHVDIVLGIKNIFKLEGVINSPESCFSFFNRSIPFFSEQCIVLRSKEQKLIKVEAPFIDEMFGLAIIKVLDTIAQNNMMLKLKFV